MQLVASGLLFDMDGTLVNSDRVVEQEWQKFCQRYSFDLDDVLAYARGRQNAPVISRYLGDTDEAQRALAEMDRNELTLMEGVTPMPGAGELLARLPMNTWALVTSAGRELATRRMKAAGLPLPAVMVCAEEVQQGKPSPEGYLMAARALSVPPANCLVFEDAPAGIRAGLSSGAWVINTGVKMELHENRCFYVPTLDLISYEFHRGKMWFSWKDEL